ncbi:hypothetical protein BJ741DRAFT_586044 [Chytriomyces cf. hyalinus JEL632]|nr:hypothetical protein BJ741DRAFT_586044 [Chytriomyces cf. hyalinus JEL632]
MLQSRPPFILDPLQATQDAEIVTRKQRVGKSKKRVSLSRKQQHHATSKKTRERAATAAEPVLSQSEVSNMVQYKKQTETTVCEDRTTDQFELIKPDAITPWNEASGDLLTEFHSKVGSFLFDSNGLTATSHGMFRLDLSQCKSERPPASVKLPKHALPSILLPHKQVAQFSREESPIRSKADDSSRRTPGSPNASPTVIYHSRAYREGKTHVAEMERDCSTAQPPEAPTSRGWYYPPQSSPYPERLLPENIQPLAKHVDSGRPFRFCTSAYLRANSGDSANRKSTPHEYTQKGCARTDIYIDTVESSIGQVGDGSSFGASQVSGAPSNSFSTRPPTAPDKVARIKDDGVQQVELPPVTDLLDTVCRKPKLQNPSQTTKIRKCTSFRPKTTPFLRIQSTNDPFPPEMTIAGTKKSGNTASQPSPPPLLRIFTPPSCPNQNLESSIIADVKPPLLPELVHQYMNRGRKVVRNRVTHGVPRTSTPSSSSSKSLKVRQSVSTGGDNYRRATDVSKRPTSTVSNIPSNDIEQSLSCISRPSTQSGAQRHKKTASVSNPDPQDRDSTDDILFPKVIETRVPVKQPPSKIQMPNHASLSSSGSWIAFQDCLDKAKGLRTGKDACDAVVLVSQLWNHFKRTKESS